MRADHQLEVLGDHLRRPLLRVVIGPEEGSVHPAASTQVGQWIVFRGHLSPPHRSHSFLQRGVSMATMSDIAREAGVSLSTVSYALSGKRAISEATRERINAAISRLSYHPHAGARALASQRAGAIGLAVPLA
ncbi:MAG: transcriptional regulator, partial [Actinomycetales bacterium]|nr:transcriptional regulator [Actinomycetales bacterium]